MQIAKWGNSLAVRLPKEITEKLGLKQGDKVDVAITGDGVLTLSKDRRREEALKRLAEIRLPLPPGYKFDRDEIYDRPRGFGEAEHQASPVEDT
jgi:antitoxin MazE